jgi:hypothetical protein
MKTGSTRQTFTQLARRGIASALVILAGTGSIYAQCLTTKLEITTGVYNGSVLATNTTDPNWYCVNKTGNFAGSLPPVGSNVEVVNGPSTWAGGGHWIADNQLHANPGIVTTVNSDLTFERRFRTCGDGAVTFDFSMRHDGWITDISIDGVSTGLTNTTVSTWQTTSSMWTPGSFTQTLPSGSHTITINVWAPPQYSYNDPTGFMMNGAISSSAAIIVDDQNPDCADYACAPRCEDKCYWTVDGNNIATGRNKLGTLTDDDIRIISNGNATPARGIITKGNSTTGGYLGWNTVKPTARLHVDCVNGNNPDDKFGQPSDIRFQNLEAGSGTILVIDKEGYVYDSHVPLDGKPEGRGTADNIAALQQEIRELKAQLAEIRSSLRTTDKISASDNLLYQNLPNPFTKETSIRFNLTKMQQSAMIIVYDLSGHQLKKYPITTVGAGGITVTSETLQPGVYLYSLVVDGQEVDSKRMTLTN